MFRTNRRDQLPKVAKACDVCRARKTKCDAANPCGSCIRHGFQCMYSTRERATSARKRFRPLHNNGLPPTDHGQAMISKRRDNSRGSIAARNESGPQDRPTSLSYEPELQLNPNTDNLGEINVHTEGIEFHGPSGTLAFLSKLRSKARQARLKGQTDPSTSQAPLPLSLVSFFHNPDHDSESDRHQPIEPYQPQFLEATTSTIDLEKTAVKLFFSNLHIIHPVLDRTKFITQCENELWDNISRKHHPKSIAKRHFLALYYSVLAVGLITADEGSSFLEDFRALMENENDGNNLPWPQRTAENFYKRAKYNLGDIFQMTSIDGTTTLFLLSVYSQSVLRPHSCYLYSGMAVRAAMAVGIPSGRAQDAAFCSRLWWALYSHELEMCSSVGRLTTVADATLYGASAVAVAENSPTAIIDCMVRFAEILRRVSQNPHHIVGQDLDGRMVETKAIDRDLHTWKDSLGNALDFDRPSLGDPEWRIKQKLVLKLRFLNACILLHRPFLSSLTRPGAQAYLVDHVRPCVDASIATVNVLYDAYLHRPFFRSWWYNTTYLLYANMVILYVLLSDIQQWPDDVLVETARRGLAVLEAMKTNIVAARCAVVVREVLNVASELVNERNYTRNECIATEVNPNSPVQENSAATTSRAEGTEPKLQGNNSTSSWNLDIGELFSNLVDNTLFDELLQPDLSTENLS